MAHALAVEGLRKQYGATQAVDGLDLTVDEGEIFGILGPNGSGKTTTVECSYGLRAADSGRIRVFGVDRARIRTGCARWSARSCRTRRRHRRGVPGAARAGGRAVAVTAR